VQWDDAHWVQLDMIGTDLWDDQVRELLKGVVSDGDGSEYGRLNET